ncbi:MAG TPA: TIGR00159 family protein [Deltaproteobacteria bacterium]|nr:MAG: TIGR00159 family protein [Deltaproteobacteria bacterium GWA2_65_63]OGP28499.1 MAG: TIGR00159 family protein [Deltaproteobacteria bacterium GWB2_65_81]OGP38691.1 MAG: TIGR00159 family protein [Deltaproteobacteria bacterium GWC2_66_88]OGP77416.1 MAG: TIGR00159 family protein [Deltaproteobacteria bacterium RBG_16_66_15]HAM32680.1 TIGR00159 family protein [Deltaproteobacteria bacterium]
MLDGLPSIHAVDVLDILLVAFIIYWVLLFIRGTRAVQMLFGLLFLMLMYVVSKRAGMVTFQWLVGNFLGNLLVVLVVVFQTEIRRGLARIGQLRLFWVKGSAPDPDVIAELSRSAFLLAEARIGAILLLEREMGLEEFVEHGKKLDALFSHELAASIFGTNSPVHDGAAVLRANRIAAAGVILPIPAESVETRGMGTRHRAAFGVASETDAVAVVVSEETGNVTVFSNRSANRAESAERLREMLELLFREKEAPPEPG